MDLTKLPPPLVAELAELLEPYGTPATMGSLWRLCADRPDVAERLRPLITWSIGNDDDIANITQICALHRVGARRIDLHYEDGTVDVVVPGLSPN